MRHHPDSDVGCYFCNDVVSPADSTSRRAMDQQCTVARPGVASIAGALCVELAINTLHHPDGHAAPGAKALGITTATEHPMGIVPHQIRGYLSHFSEIIVSAKRFDKCVACSAYVVHELNDKGYEFIKKVSADPVYLELLCGLKVTAEQEIDMEADNDVDDF